MESLKELYRIGTGPSSSHTMGPERAAHRFKEKYPQADRFLVTLYGSLAKTGKGHLTDDILVKTFAPLPVEIRFDLSDKPLPHPNTLELTAIENDKEIGFERVMSVGGGKILSEGETEDAPADVYPLSTFADIKAYCASRHMRLWQYAEECEGTEIWDYLKEVWRCMREAVTRGLETEGTLKGGLDVQRKAKMLYRQNHIDESAETRENRLVCAYAYAVSEENAAGGIIVTAPRAVPAACCRAFFCICRNAAALRIPRFSTRSRRAASSAILSRRTLHQRRGVRLSGGDRQRMFHGGGGSCGAARHGVRPD